MDSIPKVCSLYLHNCKFAIIDVLQSYSQNENEPSVRLKKWLWSLRMFCLMQNSPGNLSMSNQPGTPRDDGEMGGSFLNPFQNESVCALLLI